MEDKQNFNYTKDPAGGDKNNTDPKSSSNGRASVKKKKRARKRQSKTEQPQSAILDMHTRTSCDQSTQTEPLEIVSTQTEATQTPPLQFIHSHSTESKSTQTLRSRTTFKQAYECQEYESNDQGRDPNQLTVLTWNIDGLDFEDIKERVPSLLSCLGKYRADVVLLQELVPPYLKILQEIMKDYVFLQGDDNGYFTAILLRKQRIEFLQSNIVNYPTTEMGRNLLMASASFLGHQLCFMTSHLESLKTGSQERMNQMRRVWKKMKESPDNQTVIFGGDTNLRDWEVKKLGGLPDGVKDVWEMLGEPEDCKYTWDTVSNNNKEIPFSAQLRFDRFYLRAAKEGTNLRPYSMTLLGQERLNCGRFTSDHWGILCSFSFGLSPE